MQRIAILGGSFNPLHIGHLRVAFEVLEQLDVTWLDFVPASLPPHKATQGLLPFSMRVELIRTCIRTTDRMRVNELEAERRGPSYTYDTLETYASDCPESELYFIMGSEDLIHLGSWYRGKDLPDLTHLVLVGRGGLDRTAADEMIRDFWPTSRMVDAHWQLPETKKDIFFLEMNRLDISSSLIRDKWARGQSITYLVPEPVEAYLREHRTKIRMFWRENMSENGDVHPGNL
jgi:nicotinate-nucleotide adenylyltransferase